MFTKITNDGDSKTKNDECGKQKNNQYSAYDVEKSLEMETGGEEVIIPST